MARLLLRSTIMLDWPIATGVGAGAKKARLVRGRSRAGDMPDASNGTIPAGIIVARSAGRL
jgi:hypothetical protein